MLLFPIGTTEAITCAAAHLRKARIPLVDHPTPEVTHLLLDVPSFLPNGSLRSGADLHTYLERLPPTITVIGGNLTHPLLSEYQTLDLLQNQDYLAKNAAITADCAIRVAAKELKTTFSDTPALILGWGRIGKCLAKYLKALGTPVTVAARKDRDLSMLRALGYDTAAYSSLDPEAFGLIFNTVPEMVLEDPGTRPVKIELASKPGLGGPDVISARGLPGLLAPESSGKLIAETLIALT